METDVNKEKILKAITKAKTLAEKYTLEYYVDHAPNYKYGDGGLTVTVLMEIEEFARWLDKKGYLTKLVNGKTVRGES